MSRRIAGLRWVAPCANPWPKTRLNVNQARGVYYERRVAKATAGRYNPWFKFEDMNGVGYCAPDVVMRLGEEIICLECKLTDCWEADMQLRFLYLPVLEFLTKHTIRGIKVVRTLTPHSKHITATLQDALTLDGIPTLHWLGKGPFPWR